MQMLTPLKMKRLQAGLTCAELARLPAVSRTHLTLIENDGSLVLNLQGVAPLDPTEPQVADEAKPERVRVVTVASRPSQTRPLGTRARQTARKRSGRKNSDDGDPAAAQIRRASHAR